MSTEEEPKGNIATRSFDRLQGKYDELDPQIKKLLGTGLGGAALGGGLGYLLTGDRSGESESARRKRVLANALLGAGLGGIAGAGIPAGLSSIEQASQKSDGDKIEDALLEYAPPVAAAGGGAALSGLGLDKFLNRETAQKNKANARQNLNTIASSGGGARSTAFNNTGSPGTDSRNIRNILNGASPAGQGDILSHLKELGIGTNRMLNANLQNPLGTKLTDLVNNPQDFENAFRKMQGRKKLLGRLGMGSVLGAGGLAGLGAYESLIG